jgi:acyl-CoA synthetase (AMP-forming)/AMP-acid ligase II
MQIDFSNVSENLAKTYGDAECVVNIERGRRYSFFEFHRLTNRIVNMMRDRLQLRRGDVWLNILNNDNLSILSFFTAFKGEACACFTNTTDSLETQRNQMELVSPKVVFTEVELLPTHYPLLKEFGATVVSMDPPGEEYPEVLYFWDLLEGVSEENPNVVNDDREDCLVLRFTGGTTGAPKAVMYSIDNWMAGKDLHFAMADPVPSRSTRILHFGPISHASGIVFFPTLFKGGCNITMNDRTLQTWCRTVEQEKITGSVMVPSMLYALLVAPEAVEADLASLRTMYYGASPMSPTRLKELRQRFGDIFIQLYGSSEHVAATSVLSTTEHLPDESGDETHFASAGRVLPGVELRIMGNDGNPVPDGQDGEIWMRSRAICMGYLKNPEMTEAEFCNGFWKSGDMGRFDSSGFLYVLDRVKDTIVFNDRNVYPNIVEAAIMAHPSVQIAAVVGIPDPGCGEMVHAEIVLKGGINLDLGELREFVAERLVAINRPASMNIASELPLSPVGKVLRRVVRSVCRERVAGS